MAADPWADYRDLLSQCLGTDDIQPLLDRSSLIDLATAETLLRDLGPTDSMYLVLEGCLEVHVEVAAHTIRMGEIQPGNWVGEVAYYTRCGQACSTVTALADSRLLRLRFDDYTALVKAQTEVACRLSHVLITLLVQRLRATVHDPVLDPEGNLLMLGDLSIPLDRQAHRHAGVADFFRNLLGTR